MKRMTLRNRLLGIAVSAQPQPRERVRRRGVHRTHRHARLCLLTHSLRRRAPSTPVEASLSARRGCQKRVWGKGRGDKAMSAPVPWTCRLASSLARQVSPLVSAPCSAAPATRSGCSQCRSAVPTHASVTGYSVSTRAAHRTWRRVGTTQGRNSPWAALQMMRRRAREQHEWRGCEQQQL